MLASAVRQAASSIARVPLGARAMSMKGVKGFAEHESAVENLHFSKARAGACVCSVDGGRCAR